MPWGDWINELPTGFFLVVHVTAFAVGAGFAWLAFIVAVSGPLSCFFGADPRRIDDRGWFAAPRS